MPTASPKPCVVCACLVHDGTTRCAAHKRPLWVKRPEAKRITGRPLQRRRAELFAREPLCRECRKAGRVSEAVIRDHVVPLAEGGADDDDNVQPLCQTCSDAKSAGESARGRRRWAGGVTSVQQR
jgi:5-methylcytosine-specific restriction protein A